MRLRTLPMMLAALTTLLSGPAVFGQYTFGVRQYYISQANLPFDHFQANDNGNSIVNSYLFSYVSMAVYGSHLQLPFTFQAQMEDEFIPAGANDVEVFVNYVTGTEGAIITLDDALIVAFRGTSTNGVILPRFADHIADISTNFVTKNLGGHTVRVHSGFWNTSDSVYPGIRNIVRQAHEAGKKIWLTGHSLGAANATVTALRLHLDDDIPVQGLETFGSPRVGDASFADAFSASNLGTSLANVTRRWAMAGDPIPTFFNNGFTGFRWVYTWWGANYLLPNYESYVHVGRTHTITPSGINRYTFSYDSGELSSSYDAGGFGDEHMAYKLAIRFEMERILIILNGLQTIEDMAMTY